MHKVDAMLEVVIHEEGRDGRTVRVNRFPCRIGRGRDNEVQLGGWRVARVHAELHRMGPGIKLVDMGTISGTRVNGERVVEYGPLSERDEIMLAGYRLSLQGGALHGASVPGQHVPPPGEPAGWPVDEGAGPDLAATAGALASDDESASAMSATVMHGGAGLHGMPALRHTGCSDVPAGQGGPLQGSAVHHDGQGAVVERGVTGAVQPRDQGENSKSAGNTGNTGSQRELPEVGGDARALGWRRIVHRQLLDMIDLRRSNLAQFSTEQLRAEVQSAVERIVDGLQGLPADIDRQILVRDTVDEAVGLGPLEQLMADPLVSEIMVNSASDIFVERQGRLQQVPLAFSDDDAIRNVIERIVAPLGRRIDESSPLVDARLADGSRVNAIIPPVALKGPTITIRRFNRSVMTPQTLLDNGSASGQMLAFLEVCVRERKSIIVSGGTGSGKTTLLNVLSNLIPLGERLITIEDAAELKLMHPHLVALEARPANAEGRGAVTIRDLVRNALRMRPDRIIVGECRGAEALDMMQAMNTGHEGSLTTVHANTPRDVLSRLEVLMLMAGLELPVTALREQLASAVDLIIHQARFPDGSRRITSVTEVCGVESGRIQIQEIFRYEQTGRKNDRVQGRFRACGQIPSFYEALRERGVMVDLSIFDDVNDGQQLAGR